MKKGVELSMNLVIISAIAIVVLIVVLAIFGGKIKMFTANLESCSAKGGECKTETSCGSDYAFLEGIDCKKGDKDGICCLPIT